VIEPFKDDYHSASIMKLLIDNTTVMMTKTNRTHSLTPLLTKADSHKNGKQMEKERVTFKGETDVEV